MIPCDAPSAPKSWYIFAFTKWYLCWWRPRSRSNKPISPYQIFDQLDCFCFLRQPRRRRAVRRIALKKHQILAKMQRMMYVYFLKIVLLICMHLLGSHVTNMASMYIHFHVQVVELTKINCSYDLMLNVVCYIVLLSDIGFIWYVTFKCMDKWIEIVSLSNHDV